MTPLDKPRVNELAVDYLSDARTPPKDQLSWETSLKTMSTAWGWVLAMVTMASVMTRANSAFWALVLPGYISIVTLGICVSSRGAGASSPPSCLPG